jgi:hypothetical protein
MGDLRAAWEALPLEVAGALEAAGLRTARPGALACMADSREEALAWAERLVQEYDVTFAGTGVASLAQASVGPGLAGGGGAGGGRAVGFWDPAAKTSQFCEEIANGRLATMTVIGMFSACQRGWLLEPGCEDQQVLRGDRDRPPGHEGSPRHVPCVQAPVGFWDPAARPTGL